MRALRYSVSEICDSYGWDHYYCDLIKRFDAIEHGIFPIIEDIINDIGEYVSTFEQWGMLLLILIDDVLGMIQSFVDTVINPVIEAIYSYLWDKLRDLRALITTVTEFAQSLYDDIITPIIETVNEVIDWINNAAEYIYDVVVDTIASTIEEVYNYIIEVYEEIYTYVESIVLTIVDMVDGVVEWAIGLFDEVWGYINETVESLLEYINTIITETIDSLMEFINEVQLLLVELIGDVADAITAYIDAALEIVDTIFSAIFGIFSEPAIPDIIALGTTGDEEERQAVYHVLRHERANNMVARTKRFKISTPRIK